MIQSVSISFQACVSKFTVKSKSDGVIDSVDVWVLWDGGDQPVIQVLLISRWIRRTGAFVFESLHTVLRDTFHHHYWHIEPGFVVGVLGSLHPVLWNGGDQLVLQVLDEFVV